MAGDIALISAHFPGNRQKVFNLAPLGGVEHFKVDGNVDDAFESAGIFEDPMGVEHFPGACDAAKQYGTR
jgi:hypothetical protein